MFNFTTNNPDPNIQITLKELSQNLDFMNPDLCPGLTFDTRFTGSKTKLLILIPFEYQFINHGSITLKFEQLDSVLQEDQNLKQLIPLGQKIFDNLHLPASEIQITAGSFINRDYRYKTIFSIETTLNPKKPVNHYLNAELFENPKLLTTQPFKFSDYLKYCLITKDGQHQIPKEDNPWLTLNGSI